MGKITCFWCGGNGTVECDCTGGVGSSAADDDCCMCGGSGYTTCPECGGYGEVDDGEDDD